MHLVVGRTGVSLDEEDNFRELDLRRADGLTANGLQDALATLLPECEVDGDHVWLEVDALRELGRPLDTTWLEGFAAMIRYAAGSGWTRHDDTYVRLHVIA